MVMVAKRSLTSNVPLTSDTATLPLLFVMSRFPPTDSACTPPNEFVSFAAPESRRSISPWLLSPSAQPLTPVIATLPKSFFTQSFASLGTQISYVTEYDFVLSPQPPG